MGIYASLAHQFSLKFNSVENDIISIKNQVQNLHTQVRKIGFWSLKGREKLNKIKDLTVSIDDLKEKVEGINQEIEDMQNEEELVMEESDFQRFETLNKQSNQINVIILGIAKKLSTIKDYLTDNNLWAAFFNILDEIIESVSRISLKVFRISKRFLIQAATEIDKILPPGSGGLGGLFSKLLGGEKDEDED